jgi:hypothetical protein
MYTSFVIEPRDVLIVPDDPRLHGCRAVCIGCDCIGLQASFTTQHVHLFAGFIITYNTAQNGAGSETKQISCNICCSTKVHGFALYIDNRNRCFRRYTMHLPPEILVEHYIANNGYLSPLQ